MCFLREAAHIYSRDGWSRLSLSLDEVDCLGPRLDLSKGSAGATILVDTTNWACTYSQQPADAACVLFTEPSTTMVLPFSSTAPDRAMILISGARQRRTTSTCAYAVS